MTSNIHPESNLHALLIGIDRYLPNVLPDGTYFKTLRGCVRDVNNVESYLRDGFGLSNDHIIKLTATDNGSETPSELPVIVSTYGAVA